MSATRTTEGDRVWFTWPELSLRIGFDHMRESSAEIKGEIHVKHVSPNGHPDGHVLSGSYNLSSIETRVRMAQRLAERTHKSKDFWLDLLEYACHHAVAGYREGEPFVDLTTVEVSAQQDWLIEKLIPLGHIGGIMAQGGAGKGWIALAAVIALATGKQLPGGLNPTRRARSMYLDWELDADTARRRLDWLARGMGVETPALIYRRMDRPFVEDLSVIKRAVEANNVELLIVDSAVPATGGEVRDAEGPLRFMRAMREVPGSKLLLGHVSKATAQYTGSERASFYGNAFYQYLARNLWEIRSDVTGVDLQQGWYHAKFNLSEQFQYFGWRFHFDRSSATATLHPYDLENTVDLAERASTRDRLRTLLLRYGGQTVEELANALGLKPDLVRTTLARHKGTFGVVGTVRSQGRSEHKWGVLSTSGPGEQSSSRNTVT